MNSEENVSLLIRENTVYNNSIIICPFPSRTTRKDTGANYGACMCEKEWMKKRERTKKKKIQEKLCGGENNGGEDGERNGRGGEESNYERKKALK